MSLVLSRVGVAVVGWAGTLAIVRSLSVQSWGRFSFVFSLLGMLSIVTSAVNGRVAIRRLSDSEPGAFVGSYVLLRFALALFGYSVAIAFVVLARYPHQVVVATAVAGLVVLVSAPSNALEVVYQARVRLSRVAMAGFLGQLAQFGLIMVLAWRGSGLVLFTVPAVLCEVVAIAWKATGLGPEVRLRYSVQWGTWLVLLRTAVPLAIGGALATMYYSLDSVMLSKLDTFRSVGIYGISYKFAGVVHFIPQSLAAAALAHLIAAWPDRTDEFRAIIRRVAVMLFVAAGAVMVEFGVFAHPLISLLYGGPYPEAAGAARLVVASECVGFFTFTAMTALIAMNRNRLYPLSAGLGLCLNAGLNVWAIPRWSYHGAAWATLVTELCVATTLVVPLLRSVPGLVPVRALATAALCAALCWAVALSVEHWAPWWVAAGVSLVVYAAAIHFLRVPGPRGVLSLARDEPTG